MKFRNSLHAIALAATTYAVPAAAQEPAASPFTVSGGATLVSDYRFRGISQTNKRFALQGSFTVAHESGFYGTVWGSSIDDYVIAGADQEIDFVGGFKKTFGGTTFDVGATYYFYPGACCDVDSDFIEPYLAVSHAFGPVTAKATAAYAPKQSALDYGFGKEDNLYLAGDLTGAVPNTPLSLTAHVGRSFGPSYMTGGYKGYTDWSLGAGYTWKNLTAGIAYVDANKDFFSPSGRNLTKGGVVLSLGAAF
jgi:uncharacterized protein (TIGR02001 family)